MAELGHLRGRGQAGQRSKGAAVWQDPQGAVGDSQRIGQGGGEIAEMAEPPDDQARGIHSQVHY